MPPSTASLLPVTGCPSPSQDPIVVLRCWHTHPFPCWYHPSLSLATHQPLLLPPTEISPPPWFWVTTNHLVPIFTTRCLPSSEIPLLAILPITLSHSRDVIALSPFCPLHHCHLLHTSPSSLPITTTAFNGNESKMDGVPEYPGAILAIQCEDPMARIMADLMKDFIACLKQQITRSKSPMIINNQFDVSYSIWPYLDFEQSDFDGISALWCRSDG